MNKIGIDIGRVIISGDTDKENNIFFGKDFVNAHAVKNVFHSIKQIIEKYGKENVYLVSKCSSQTELRTLKWLDYNNFYKQTGFNRVNINFGRERKDKKKICEKIGIQTFIDDRYSVLEHLKDLNLLFLFNPNKEEMEKYVLSSDKENIHLVYNWEELIRSILC